MARRVLTAALLLGLLLPTVYFGGIPFLVLVAAFLAIATSEYNRMFSLRGYQPSQVITVGSVLVILGARAFWPEAAPVVLSMAVLTAMGFHMWRYETGRDEAAVDLAISLGAIIYLGWITAYLIDVRQLPDGLWWLILIFLVVWVADSTAYFVGVRYGRHKMFVRLSPKKSWEGYIAGALAGAILAGLLGSVFGSLGLLDVSPWPALSLGLILSTLTTLGDLGESLFKRFAGIKDSGTFLPGHGGAFDRIDSLIWAGVLGYYWIRLVLM